ncbi:hypothetical protein T492DRAFT_889393 [Pavlovales sp. CCMP2436]|nr:hypothetical protein T492DRAFT_889393 [Pavlovales sp. CCMP2436]
MAEANFGRCSATSDARRRLESAEADGTADGEVRPPGLPPPSDDYLKARYGNGVGLGAKAGYQRQIDLMRQRFMYGLQVKLNDPNDTFDFGTYLTQCSAGITAEIVEVHPITWILVAASLAVIYVCNSFLSHLGIAT